LSDYDRWINRARSRVRARVEHSIGVIKRVFGFAKVPCRSAAFSSASRARRGSRTAP
jgi:hypothetical protein